MGLLDKMLRHITRDSDVYPMPAEIVRWGGDVGKPLVDGGLQYYAIGEDFAGKTIASSELYWATDTHNNLGHWFLTFADGTRVVVGLYSGDFLGISLTRLMWYNQGVLDNMFRLAPMFWSEDMIAEFNQLRKEKQEEEARQRHKAAATKFIDDGLISGKWDLQGAKVKVQVEFPDGDMLTDEREVIP